MEIQTDAMIIISFAAAEDPPMIDTIKLGVMAMHLVIKFLSHFFIFKSKKPYDSKPVISTIAIIKLKRIIY